VPLVKEVMLEQPVNQVKLASQDLRALLDLQDRLDPEGIVVLLDNKDNLDLRELLELPVILANQETREVQDSRERRVFQGTRGDLVLPDQMASLAHQDRSDLQVPLALLASQAPLDSRVHRDKQETEDNQATQDLPDPQDQQAHQELLDCQDKMASLEPPALLVTVASQELQVQTGSQDHLGQ
jgi:hypothetical protein